MSSSPFLTPAEYAAEYRRLLGKALLDALTMFYSVDIEVTEEELRKPLSYWFPAVPQPKPVETPTPKHCTHKCVQCGMYYQHPIEQLCATAKHKTCKK